MAESSTSGSNFRNWSFCDFALFFSVHGVGWVGEMGGVSWGRQVNRVGGGGVGIYTRALIYAGWMLTPLWNYTSQPWDLFCEWDLLWTEYKMTPIDSACLSDHLVPSWWHCSERFWTLGIRGRPSSLEEAGDLGWILRFYSPALLPALLPDWGSNVTICVTCQLSGLPCYMCCISLNCKLQPTLPPLSYLIMSMRKRMNKQTNNGYRLSVCSLELENLAVLLRLSLNSWFFGFRFSSFGFMDVCHYSWLCFWLLDFNKICRHQLFNFFLQLT